LIAPHEHHPPHTDTHDTSSGRESFCCSTVSYVRNVHRSGRPLAGLACGREANERRDPGVGPRRSALRTPARVGTPDGTSASATVRMGSHPPTEALGQAPAGRRSAARGGRPREICSRCSPCMPSLPHFPARADPARALPMLLEDALRSARNRRRGASLSSLLTHDLNDRCPDRSAQCR